MNTFLKSMEYRQNLKGELKLNTEFKIKYEDDAMLELDDIYLYIRDKLKEAKIAENTIRKIRNRIKILNKFPLAYKLLRKTKKLEYRKFIIKNYIIIYSVNLKEKEINILHIYNQKQKIKNKKSNNWRSKIHNFVLIYDVRA